MATKDSRARAANMREVFTFDDELKFQVRTSKGALVCECESLDDAERALNSSPDGAFIAYPRAALDVENERQREKEQRERAEKVAQKLEARREEYLQAQRLAFMVPLDACGEFSAIYEEAFRDFVAAARRNGRDFS